MREAFAEDIGGMIFKYNKCIGSIQFWVYQVWTSKWFKYNKCIGSIMLCI